MLCYVDYTCRYSYRMAAWLPRLGRPVEWRTFSLKEVNRRDGEPSAFDDISSPSIFALALSHAARAHDFDRFHAETFDAFQQRRLSTDDLLEIAARAGVDADSFNAAEWMARAAAEHREAVERWAVFGTPTLIVDGAAVFMKLNDLPDPADDERTWQAVEALARAPVAEIHVRHRSGTTTIDVTER